MMSVFVCDEPLAKERHGSTMPEAARALLLAVYGEGWYYEWGAFIYIGIILGFGLLWYGVKGRHHIGTLESHAVATKAELGNVEPGPIGL